MSGVFYTGAHETKQKSAAGPAYDLRAQEHRRAAHAQMKFGKDLQQYKLPGWEDDYLDYKGLKYILKKLEEGVPREEVDGEFFQALEDDLEKARRPLPCFLACFAPAVRDAKWSR